MPLRMIFFFSLLPRNGEGAWFLPNTKVNQINTKAVGKYFFVKRTSTLIQKARYGFQPFYIILICYGHYYRFLR